MENDVGSLQRKTKGSTVFPDGTSQTEIRVSFQYPTLKRDSEASDLRVRFLVNGIDLCKW